jgi:hypothetical protein
MSQLEGKQRYDNRRAHAARLNLFEMIAVS